MLELSTNVENFVKFPSPFKDSCFFKCPHFTRDPSFCKVSTHPLKTRQFSRMFKIYKKHPNYPKNIQLPHIWKMSALPTNFIVFPKKSVCTFKLENELIRAQSRAKANVKQQKPDFRGKNPTLQFMIQIWTKMHRVLSQHTIPNSTKFGSNWLSSFRVILLTNNKQTNMDENRTSLMEI